MKKIDYFLFEKRCWLFEYKINGIIKKWPLNLFIYWLLTLLIIQIITYKKYTNPDID